MADTDVLPQRGVPALALVDSAGVASNGSQTVAQLAARGMRAICAVDGTGVSVSGATVAQLASAGIRAFCPVDELGVAQSGTTADALRRAGIRPMVLLNNTGIALTGSATMLTLAQRGLQYFCPVDEAGNATTMGAVILVSNTTVLESIAIGATVGTLSVAGGTGTYVFTLTNTAGGKFTTAGTNGVNLNTAAALDYETATSHTITVSATNGGTPITRTIVIAVTNVVEDTTPNAFTFTDVTGAALSTVVESDAITVSGIDGPSTMTVTGGEYSVNGGSYASASTSVVAGNTVKVRGTSSASNSTAVNVTLTIGGVSDTFTITTLAASGGTIATPTLTSLTTATDSGSSSTDAITNDTTPDLNVDWGADPPLTGDVIEVRNGGTLIVTHTVTASEAGSGIVSLDFPLSAGSNSLTVTHKRGASSSSPSSAFIVVIDTTAPALTSATASQASQTTATLNVTTNEANGVLYYVVTGSSTAPTPAQIKAGQDDTGAAALYAGSQTITTTGAKTATATGLVVSATRRAYCMHEDVAGNQSNVTQATWNQADITAPVLSSPTGVKTGSSTATLGVTTDETNGTLYGVLTLNSTPPTKAQIKAGQNAAGAAAAYAFNQAVSTTTPSKSATGLTASTTYFAYYMQEDASANQSNVPTGVSFTTDAGGFSVLGLAGLIGWYDASVAASMKHSGATATNGQTVDQWLDQSPAGNHLVGGTSSPTLNTTGFNTSYPALVFNGIADCMQKASWPMGTGTTLTAYVVAQMNTGSGNYCRLLCYTLVGQANSYDNAGSAALLLRNVGNFQMITAPNNVFGNASNFSIDVPHVIGTIFTGSQFTVYVDGVAGTPNTGFTTPWGTGGLLQLGNDSSNVPWKGPISEFIICTGNNTSDATNIYNYLKAKWGL